MAVSRSAASSPYAVEFRWSPREGGTLIAVRSVHHAERAAVDRARGSYRAMAWLWGSYPCPFSWHVIDRRDGKICKIIP